MPLHRPEPGPGSGPDRTVRLGADPAAERTVPPGGAVPAGAMPAPPAASGAEDAGDAEDAACATFLDPTVWGTSGARAPEPVPVPPEAVPVPPEPVPVPPEAVPVPPEPVPVPPEAVPVPPEPVPVPPEPDPAPQQYEVRRFGPGVPPVAVAVWHGAPPPWQREARLRRRRAVRWLVPAAVLVVLLAFLAARCRSEPPLILTGVTVGAEPAGGPPCGGTAVITATVGTDGHAGTIRYRWLRSDGTSSGELVQPVQSGERRADLVLHWSFDGRGTMRATATVDILEPRRLGAATSFTYACQG
ncbi:hypothetical protein [Streptomyces sp. CB01881]|uniref:hypothetical protein n=1 Tax=Streptomyces sp. CB01881 TaxID=2078691 RepID=UPI000CDCB9F6|nr:hypothetical protein [Streptomyces sp. CB01881]AUY53322.1 hypothetical protein C2142_35460 [Streptomyces sp. CB01881]TYC69475.1 hypothetical protein EH183_35525 [Streptomyces sp. CB01881]